MACEELGLLDGDEADRLIRLELSMLNVYGIYACIMNRNFSGVLNDPPNVLRSGATFKA